MSSLRQSLHEYLELRQAMGFKFSVAERLTESFESASSPDDPAPMLS